MSRGDILRDLGLKKKDRGSLEGTLDQLSSEGKILQLRGGTFGLVDNLKLLRGVLQIQRSGVGFVLPEDKKRADIFISPAHFGEAWNGDRVMVALLPNRGGRREEGRIVRVLERRSTRFTVRASASVGQGVFLCLPTDPRQHIRVMAQAGELADEVRLGDILQVEISEKIEKDIWNAQVLKVIGPENEAAVQESLVKINHSVPTDFPDPVTREAEALPELPDPSDFSTPSMRRDMRDQDFVTIDGAKARDFDDAILVRREGRGWRLWVAIADVSHYVRPGSALDTEARTRGNSYYFPQSVEPMFPEALSNGLCSLNPDVPRLAMVAEVFFDAQGIPGKSAFYPAVIESKARLTYAQVNRALFVDDPEVREPEREKIAHVLPMLEESERLARKLFDRRRSRGSLDFDLPEPEILFNLYGETVDIRPRVRNFAHQLIEEFMIAANEAVARFLTEKEMPCMYRIHPSPDEDKLRSLVRLLGTTNLADRLPARLAAWPAGKDLDPSPQDVQGLLNLAEGTDLEFMVGRLVLRTMMQAKYQPEHEGHYGLASECYCHFTSPIRRYADLVVHRSLKIAIGAEPAGERTGSGVPKSLRGLDRVAEELSVLERRAMDAEREILKRLTIIYLYDHMGEEFEGVINSMVDFGFWVEINEGMAEGMVRVSTLNDDYYGYIPERQELLGERTGNRFRLGQKVRVRLVDVNLAQLEVNFELVREDDEEDMEKRPRRSGRSRKPRTEGAAERSGRSSRNNRQKQSHSSDDSAPVRKKRRKNTSETADAENGSRQKAKKISPSKGSVKTASAPAGDKPVRRKRKKPAGGKPKAEKKSEA